MIRALAALAEVPGEHHSALAFALGLPGCPSASGHTDALVLGVHPYASVYLGPEGMLGGQARDRVASFWRALGLVPPADCDHLSVLLGLYASLLDAETDAELSPGEPGHGKAAAAARGAKEALLSEHLLSWAPLFCHAVGRVGDETHAAWANLLLDVLLDETARGSEPVALASHLRDAPVLDGEPESLAELVDEACTPVLTGVVLTRLDIARGARNLGLGLRVGERRYMLRALMEQDAGGTLLWLAGEASSWELWYAGLERRAGPCGPYWAARARVSADLWTSAAHSSRHHRASDIGAAQDRSAT